MRVCVRAHVYVCVRARLYIFDDANQDSLLASIFQTDSKQHKRSNKLGFSSLGDDVDKIRKRKDGQKKKKGK